jgi:hypothetical protein
MSKNGCKCRPIGPAARPLSAFYEQTGALYESTGDYVEALGDYVEAPTAIVGGIGRKGDAFGGKYTQPLRMAGRGDFLSIDIKPFLLLGAAYLGYRYFIKKHS